MHSKIRRTKVLWNTYKFSEFQKKAANFVDRFKFKNMENIFEIVAKQ